MAKKAPPGFQNVDWSQWQSWPTVMVYNHRYYQVPGNTDYVFDPYSGSNGRVTLRPDLDVSQRKAVNDAVNPQPKQPGAAEQLVPVVGGLAGTVGGVWAVNKLTGAIEPAAAATSGSDAASGVAETASAGAAETPGLLQAATPYLGLVGAGLGAKGVYDATQMSDKKDAAKAGAISGAGLGAGLGVAAPLVGLGPLGWGALGLMALGGAGLGGGLGGILAHKTTGMKQAERFGNAGHAELADQWANHDYFAGTGGEVSRDEKFLTPDAIRVNPDNYNNIPDWDNWSKDSQDRFLSQMLNEGKVQEKKGGIYYDDKRAQQIAAEIRATSTPATTALPKPVTGSKNTTTNPKPTQYNYVLKSGKYSRN